MEDYSAEDSHEVCMKIHMVVILLHDRFWISMTQRLMLLQDEEEVSKTQ